jgi:hypothetical protein
MSISSVVSTPPIYTPSTTNTKAATPQPVKGNDPDHDGDVDGAGPDKDGTSTGVNILA